MGVWLLQVQFLGMGGCRLTKNWQPDKRVTLTGSQLLAGKPPNDGTTLNMCSPRPINQQPLHCCGVGRPPSALAGWQQPCQKSSASHNPVELAARCCQPVVDKVELTTRTGLLEPSLLNTANITVLLQWAGMQQCTQPHPHPGTAHYEDEQNTPVLARGAEL